MNFNIDIIYKILHAFIDDNNWTVSIIYHKKSCYIYYKKELIGCIHYNEKRKIEKKDIKMIINIILDGLLRREYIKLTCKLKRL